MVTFASDRAIPLAALSVFIISEIAVNPTCCLAQHAAQQVGNQTEADNMFRNLDANRDGRLTMDEAGSSNRQILQRIFEMVEKPASGSVPRDEFQKVFERHRAGGNSTPRTLPPQQASSSRESTFPSILRLLDANQDERLSKSELTRLSQLFDRLDSNKDGLLDAEELNAAEQLAAEASAERAPSSSDNRTTTSTNPDRRSTSSESKPPARPRPLPARTTPNSSGPARGSESSRLNGIWRGWVVRGRGENPNEGEMEVELTIEGNRITGRELGTQRAPGGLGAGSFTMTGNGNSGNLDADGTAGPQDGRHFLGIYELQGDTLRWCVSNRGRQRPSVMASDRGNYLMILRRQRS